MTAPHAFASPDLRSLETGLATLGFQRYPQPALTDNDRKVLWQRACADVVPVCAYNGTLNLNVALFETRLPAPHLTHQAVEAELQAQLPDGQWARLALTGLEPAQVLSQVEDIQAKLVAAWQALARLSVPATAQAGSFVIRYADGAYNFGPDQRNGFPVSLAEATRYETREAAMEKAQDLGPEVEVLDVRDIAPGTEPLTLLSGNPPESAQ